MSFGLLELDVDHSYQLYQFWPTKLIRVILWSEVPACLVHLLLYNLIYCFFKLFT